VPSVVAFQVKEANNKLDSEWKKNLDTSLLYHELGYVHNSSCHKVLIKDSTLTFSTALYQRTSMRLTNYSILIPRNRGRIQSLLLTQSLWPYASQKSK
jgi:hypothetical protein